MSGGFCVVVVVVVAMVGVMAVMLTVALLAVVVALMAVAGMVAVGPSYNDKPTLSVWSIDDALEALRK